MSSTKQLTPFLRSLSIFSEDDPMLGENDDSSCDSRSNKGSEQSVVVENSAEEGRKLSWSVFTVLAFSAGAFGLATYFLLAISIEWEFKSEFQSYARETAEIAENNAGNTLGQLKSLSTAITSIARSVQDFNDFPNVTVPHFDLRAREISELTGAEMILWVPFIEEKKRKGWEQYAVENQEWIGQDYLYRDWTAKDIVKIPENIHSFPSTDVIEDSRRGFYDTGFMEKILGMLHYNSQNFSAPIAQFGPGPVDTSLVMMDLLTHPRFKKEIVTSVEYDVPVISEILDLRFLLRYINYGQNDTDDKLRSFTLHQVKKDFTESSPTAGFLIAIVPWDTFFCNLLPDNVNGIAVNVEIDCGSNFTYVVNGGKNDTAREGDLHDPKYDDMAFRTRFFWKDHPKGISRHCHFDLVICPSDEFHATYESNTPLLYAGIVVLVFLFTAILFFLYDLLVFRRQKKVASQAARATALVTSLFPAHVGKRLLEETELEATNNPTRLSSLRHSSGPLHNLLGTDSPTRVEDATDKPMADLYPSCTIMFADIVGFTAWSSTRDPTQVFILLESIYNSFDKVAKRRRVFKVETVGDCYVAVAGLPEPREDHATVMAFFAGDCLRRMRVLCNRLEVELGPDTADLGIRIGLHSGPVTAGVLRGERARFQLFGDTVNTTARVESTGQKNRIHLSKETADILLAAGKGHWLTARGDKVFAKGKGELHTYWLTPPKRGVGSSVVSTRSLDSITEHGSEDFENMSSRVDAAVFNEKYNRLVEWNVDVLTSILKQISAKRLSEGTEPDSPEKMKPAEQALTIQGGDEIVMDEVAEIIQLPKFDAQATASNQTINSAELDRNAISQLRDYVRSIASMYRDNPFHNYEHASHVTLSVVKLLGRIVAPDITCDSVRDLHDGITSDPLLQFAVVFSAMIHDVDHPGVSNAQLVAEDAELAFLYKNKSVAEQNSVDLAWNLLMEDTFQDLRRAIYSTVVDFRRFRQLIVNTILATDIVDKELKMLRNGRWEKAFAQPPIIESEVDATNRKVTIVIEHLIQASDVAHTMQHWHIYRKWNSRLFHETYKAYREGRAGVKDPAEVWYAGELGFFDFYIIPLARKLRECGVFGVSCDEYLGYALQNRREWEIKGRTIVQEMKEEAMKQTNYSTRSELLRLTSENLAELANKVRNW